jgi:hypothetical protein
MIPQTLDSKFLDFEEPEHVRELRDALERAGYRDSGILELLGVKDFPAIRGKDLPLLLHRTRGGGPLETLVRLFLVEVPVPLEFLEHAVHPFPLDMLGASGIIEIRSGEALPGVKIIPFRDMLFAFDLPRRLETPEQRDYVMGLGRSSLTLANLTVRRPSRATLDLGCGCGIQALLAASHSETLLAVDLNPRAVRFTAFNALLNDLDNVQTAEGDLFEPAAGRLFDLIVSNPPFVISPEVRYTYRDGGMAGDEICRSIVRRAPAFLNEGGFCQILCNWCEFAGEDWRERLAGWFQDTGCDVWVIRSESRDAATYASTWIQHTERDLPERLSKRFDEWTGYYEDQGIQSVGAGLITMRRRAGGSGWFRADEAPEKMLGSCGRDIEKAFAARDWMEQVADERRWLSSAFRVNPEIRLKQTFRPGPDGWEAEEVKLSRTSGLAYTVRADVPVANLLAQCNGSRTLGELVSAMAASLETELDSLTAPVCALARNFVECGFLEIPRPSTIEGSSTEENDL